MKKSKWFVIRTDSSVDIGIGHAMRCLALAEWAIDEGYSFVFVYRHILPVVQEKAREVGAQCCQLAEVAEQGECQRYKHSAWLGQTEENDLDGTMEVVLREMARRGAAPAFVVVDSYSLGAPWECAMGSISKVVAIDDLNDRPHACSVLVDQTFAKTAAAYDGLLQTSTKVLIGSKFALLRKEFSADSTTKNTCFKDGINILVSLGGVDKSNRSLEVMNALDLSVYREKISVVCVTSSANPNLDCLLSYSNAHANIDVLVDVQNMSELMEIAHFCIGAPGSSTWERCAVGLPFMSIPIADNQLEILKSFEVRGLTTNILGGGKVCIRLIDQYLLDYLGDGGQNKYEKMVHKLRGVCDGNGVRRVLEEIGRYGGCDKTEIKN